ncbi:MAG TPA: methyltransferase domain-containing protein [Acidimicrobiia bacterium]|nr:methyltransferase domain-containing protein [Acidimicrobiia bacterium]
MTVDRVRLRSEIRRKYEEVAREPDAEYHFFTGRKAARHVGYPEDVLDDLPSGVADAFAGVANPFHHGLPSPGSTVVDVGSGAGLDAVIAARSVGPEGRVIGVDMTPDMLDRARRSADLLGLGHLEFREGYAEELPVPDQSVDLVISNGVLNLVPDKLGAYREIHRILRPGGRFQIADIVVERPVPEGAQRDIDLWTG